MQPLRGWKEVKWLLLQKWKLHELLLTYYEFFLSS